MTDGDRKLLEAAAKAAGLLSQGPCESFGKFVGLSIRYDDYPGGVCWNPLAYDSDALRLAVGRRIDVVFVGETTIEARSGDGPIAIEYVNLSDDPHAATRRAIVRAAAALAKE